jgi:hypothetical protein
MFDKFSEAAEKLATNVSRRAFLGRLGEGALALAAVVGGVLALPSRAQATRPGKCCTYRCGFYECIYSAVHNSCPCGGVLGNCPTVSDCLNRSSAYCKWISC